MTTSGLTPRRTRKPAVGVRSFANSARAKRLSTGSPIGVGSRSVRRIVPTCSSGSGRVARADGQAPGAVYATCIPRAESTCSTVSSLIVRVVAPPLALTVKAIAAALSSSGRSQMT